MPWTPLAERFTALPLILSGPLLRRVEPQSVTVWLALKEPRIVTLRVYARNNANALVQQIEGTHRTIRLGNHLHIVAVTARSSTDSLLRWGELYYYDLFFQDDGHPGTPDMPVPEIAAHRPKESCAVGTGGRNKLVSSAARGAVLRFSRRHAM